MRFQMTCDSLLKYLQSSVYTIILLFLHCQSGNADDSISFLVDMDTQEDGSLIVQETVTIELTESSLENGFERILPAKTWLENERNVSIHSDQHLPIIEVISAELNNKPVSFKLIPTSADVRDGEYGSNVLLRVGAEGIDYPPGHYQFNYHYKISGQIGYHEKYEWLNWHVTRNRFLSTVDKVNIKVKIPSHIPISKVKTSAYQSIAIGASIDEAQPEIINHHTLEFNSQNVLRYKLGLTFPFQSFFSDYRRKIKFWESDYIKAELTDVQEQQELMLMTANLCLLMLFMFFLLKKQNKQIITDEELMYRISPAVLGYYLTKKYKTEWLMSSLIQLAQRGLINIKNANNPIELEKTGSSTSGCRHQDICQLFSEAFENSSVISSALLKNQALQFPILAKKHQKILDNTNIFSLLPEVTLKKPFIITLILSFFIFLINLSFIHTDMPLDELLPFSFFTLFFLLGTGVMALFFYKIAKLFIVIFLLIDWFLVNEFINMAGWNIIFFTIALCLINLVFWYLLSGFSAISKSSLNRSIQHLKSQFINKEITIKSQEQYVDYLLYSYALNLDKQWNNDFIHHSFVRQQPTFIDKGLWGGGSLKPFYRELERLLNPK